MRLFTVYNPSTGDIIRSGGVTDASVAFQATTGEAVLVDVQAQYLEEKVVIVGGKPTVVRRSEIEIEERSAKPDRSDVMSVLVEALKTKGIVLTPEDIQAATEKVSPTAKTL